MNTSDWQNVFKVCSTVLGKGSHLSTLSESWCSWTTFTRLNEDACYWSSGLPNIDEYNEVGILDGDTWGQPFNYNDLAHLIIPKKFYWETAPGPDFKSGYKIQNIESVSEKLNELGCPHRLTYLVLEIKCY